MATHSGYLVIADISGYTAYLTSSELEHANPILRSLLGTIVGELGDPLNFLRMEGDAVLAYSDHPRRARPRSALHPVVRAREVELRVRIDAPEQKAKILSCVAQPSRAAVSRSFAAKPRTATRFALPDASLRLDANFQIHRVSSKDFQNPKVEV